MKTNFRNIIAVSAVAFAGIFSANATENDSEFFTTTGNNIVDYRTEAQLVTRHLADMAEARATQIVMERNITEPTEIVAFFENEVSAIAETNDFQTEALQITHEVADREEAKATQKIMDKGFVSPAEITTATTELTMNDFRVEAQLITKEIADREETKATQKVMDKGLIEENLEEIDFRAEAQLKIRLIADQEEVKALQKLASEGKIAETK